MRFVLASTVRTLNHTNRQRALRIVKFAIEVHYQMKWKLRNLEKSLLFIQNRFLRRRTTHEAKLEIVENYWNKFVGQLYFENLNIGDQKTREMVAGIIRVKKDIRRAVLTKYLAKCGQLHSLAFFQWRYKFPSNLCYSTR